MKVTMDLRWYTVALVAIEIGLLLFGLWAFFDTLSIGAPKAAWRFLLLFIIWALPGLAVLTLFRPRAKAAAAPQAAPQPAAPPPPLGTPVA